MNQHRGVARRVVLYQSGYMLVETQHTKYVFQVPDNVPVEVEEDDSEGVRYVPVDEEKV